MKEQLLSRISNHRAIATGQVTASNCLYPGLYRVEPTEKLIDMMEYAISIALRSFNRMCLRTQAHLYVFAVRSYSDSLSTTPSFVSPLHRFLLINW